MNTIKFNEKIEVQAQDTIDINGRVRILLLLRRNNLELLPEDFDWAWLTKEGRLTVRISKYYFKTFRIKLDKKLVEECGTIAGKFKVEKKKYLIDFTSRFNWHAGDFGDSNSCFWGSNEDARKIMQQAGFFAIRFYDESGNGIGRAWVAPNLPEENSYIIFNAYGPLALRQVAAIFAAHMGDLPVRQIKIYNRGRTDGTLYLNSGTGMLIGHNEYSSPKYDFELHDAECLGECVNCACVLYRDEEFYRVGGEYVCESCYDQYYFNCYMCSEYFHNRDAREVVRRMGTRYEKTVTLCPRCEELYAFTCAVCETCVETNSGEIQLSNGVVLCLNCAEERAHVCEYCGDVDLEENMHQLDGPDHNEYCHDCYRQYADFCHNCKRDLPNVMMHTHGLCINCHIKEEEQVENETK